MHTDKIERWQHRFMTTATTMTPLETILLTAGSARASLAPTRGGMVTRFSVGDRPVLFLDESTLVDTTKNVRGGVPVLFPSPGKLEDDHWARAGAEGVMGQHGFARNQAWEVVSQEPDVVTLRIASNDATHLVYPWNFVATYRYALRANALRIDQHFENTGATPMPFGAGFHPYFEVKNKAAASIPTHATKAFDNTTKTFVELTGPIDLTAKEVDLHLVDHGASEAILVLDDARIVVRASPELQRWVIWTVAGKDFVCVEPWTSPGNALNTGENLLVAEPGQTVSLWTEIGLEPL